MTTVGRFVRRFASVRPIARFLDWYPIRRAIATVLRSGTVRSRGRFVVRELTGRGGASAYRLRGSGRCIFLRHGTADIVTLDEVFYRRDYALPPDVESNLRGLSRPAVALDVGANIGLFGVFFLEIFPDARVVAIEADEQNVEVLRLCASANGGEARWEIISAAAAAEDGVVPFLRGGYSLSRIDETGDPVDAVDVFRHLAGADIAKIDIEGGEWSILADRRLAEVPTPAIVLEYHPHLCPEDDPRGTAVRAMTNAGYSVSAVHHYPHGHGVLWGVRPL